MLCLQLSVELMVTISSLKSLIAWIWTWVINDWLSSSGVLTVFCVIGAVNLAAYLPTCLLWWKDKNIRIWLHRKKLLAACGLE
jgi:hypothetical protein